MIESTHVTREEEIDDLICQFINIFVLVTLKHFDFIQTCEDYITLILRIATKK